MSELIPLKFYMDDKDVPVEFHLLDGLEPSGAMKLEPREHLICVYGDNWIKDVKYQLRYLPAAPNVEPIKIIVESEKVLLAKKTEMAKFQEEFVEAKKRLVMFHFLYLSTIKSSFKSVNLKVEALW
jgi:hypothetical protein